MTGILKVDQWKDSGDNALMTSDGAGNLTANTGINVSSSNNLLVGKTTTARTDVGSEMRSTGFIRGTRLDGHPFDAVRTNSDGDIMKFYRDAGQVGQITAYTTGISINLGGTATANALDDYEEGTWSPQYTATGGSITATTTAHASYVKVGNMVYIQCKVATYQSSLTGDLSITGLPFTSSNVSNKHNAFAIGRYYYWNTDMPNLQVINDPNTSTLILFKNATNATSRSRVQGSDTANGVNQSNLVIMGCYQVD